ncbi:hypothetical protein Tsp_11728 [Trichinella spiralis]|uniref:hypothetical protein n=1 Tax=Trichinella spiralis TaxID=6334 RepID=UPI0001EFE6E8|nr:hypothetical protein Tsp_11728 [Trichinella spiralis]
MLGAFSRVCLRNTIFCEEWRHLFRFRQQICVHNQNNVKSKVVINLLFDRANFFCQSRRFRAISANRLRSSWSTTLGGECSRRHCSRVQVSATACLVQASNAGALFVHTVFTAQQCCLQVHTHSTLPSYFEQ